MPARSPVRISSLDASAWNGADGVVVENFLWDATADAAVTTTDTTLSDTRASWITDEWIGEVVAAGGKTLTVTSNTATVLTGASWSGGGNPGSSVSYRMDKGLDDDNTTSGIIKQGGKPRKLDRANVWRPACGSFMSTA